MPEASDDKTTSTHKFKCINFGELGYESKKTKVSEQVSTGIVCAAQAHEEGQGPPEECLDIQGLDHAQPEQADESVGSRDGSEPGIKSDWDVCLPAASDAACLITLVSTGQPRSWTNAAAEQELPATSRDGLTHRIQPEGADVVPKPSVSPAYSMLPWDKPGMWPAAKDSVQSMKSQANTQSSTAGKDAPVRGDAALSAPIAFMRQPSRLSATAAGSLQQPGLPESMKSHARPFDMRPMHGSRQHAPILEGASAQRRQHDGISSGADLQLPARNPSVTVPGFASVKHCQQGGTTAQPDPLSTAHCRGANTPKKSSLGTYQGLPHLSKEAFVAELLGHVQAPSQQSHTASPAQGSSAERMVEAGQYVISSSMIDSAEQAVAWERPFSRTSEHSKSADAVMQSSRGWLSTHGYSDAAVHVTATLAEAALPASIAGSHGDHVKAPSPVNEPLPAQKLADIPYCSYPSSLCVSARKEQVGPPVSASLYAQTDVGHLWSGTASSRTGSAINLAVPPASNAQNPMNGQDVALNRTMPSIWDLDM